MNVGYRFDPQSRNDGFDLRLSEVFARQEGSPTDGMRNS